MPPHEALQRFVNLIDQLNSSAIRLTGRQYPVFRRVALRQPDVGRNPELAFMQLVPWLYVHYVEAGQPGLNFLMRQAESVASGTASARRHIETVKHLRTSLQHNLDLSKDRNIEIERRCGEWFGTACELRPAERRLICAACRFFLRLQNSSKSLCPQSGRLRVANFEIQS